MTLHTVEKIGGTSMSRFAELLDNILIGDRSSEQIYNRIFVVSAYSGITNMLLEHKKMVKPVFTNISQKQTPSGKMPCSLLKVGCVRLMLNLSISA